MPVRTSRLRFETSWGDKYPAIGPGWRAHSDRPTTLIDVSPAIRKVIDTTNANESLNYSLRKVLKNPGAFADDESIKILYLALQDPSKKWNRPMFDASSPVSRKT